MAQSRARRAIPATVLGLLLVVSACAQDAPDAEAATEPIVTEATPSPQAVPPTADQRPDVTDTTPEPEPEPQTEAEPVASAAEPAPPATTVPVVTRAAAPNGRTAPLVASTAEGLAAQLAAAEAGLRSADATAEELAAFGHLHQVVIRKLGYELDWDIPFFEALPTEYHSPTLLHVSARRALIDLKSGYDAADFIPAWELVEPEPAESLLSYYRAAELATGIEWEYLAAINLVETGMGRIRGLSSAGAQGPMQFLPTTWAESGIGAGDINDPNDAINGAARYLVRRGGPTDMAGVIWGYNNSDDYVTAVQAYAELLRRDPDAYQAIYNWEIYFFTEAGDVWLPTGLRNEASIDLDDYLDANPWSFPDPGLR